MSIILIIIVTQQQENANQHREEHLKNVATIGVEGNRSAATDKI
jgi:hypothetical protein